MTRAPIRFPLSRAGRDRLLAVLAGLALWEIVARSGRISDLLLAPPSQVLAAGLELAQRHRIQQAFLLTGTEVLGAFAIAALGGVVMGVLMARSDFLYRVFNPPMMMLFATPKMIFLPLFILFFGIGITFTAVYGGVSGLFPVAITVTAGVRMIEPRLLVASRSMGAGAWQEFVHVIVPGALPSVIAALWFGLKQALGGVLLAELFISEGKGIGYWIIHYTSIFQPDDVYALILGLSLVAILLGTFWRWLEGRFSRWRAPTDVELMSAAQ